MANTTNGSSIRPGISARTATAPSKPMNGHFAAKDAVSKEQYEHGVQVIDQDKSFNDKLNVYLNLEGITPAGFNYHLISVFGSQSTGKSTLLNHLFGTQFGTMSEEERRQTTKGIWLSKNRRETAQGGAGMAENILVMDVEGTDGRERGEDQDFERKAALFALATSEVLIVNIWEHQVGLYQGANMGLLKTVFEVNLQLFLKDRSVPRSLLFFVIRDHIGNTPLEALRKTLLQDLSKIWASLSKPTGLEKSVIEDYFDFAFVALPHKILLPDKFEAAVAKLGKRFKEARKDPKKTSLQLDQDAQGVFLPEYHRRIPADGFAHFAEAVWDQIVNNKDLDLPTQQELLAQFRCDEILRDVLVGFDSAIGPFEELQSNTARSGKASVLDGLGAALKVSRLRAITDFETEASRYHKTVYETKRKELLVKVDGRLRILSKGQLSAAHKTGVKSFSDRVTDAVRAGQKQGSKYDFAQIVAKEMSHALLTFENEATSLVIDGATWSEYHQELNLFRSELNEVSTRLRKEEMKRLATRLQRLVRSRLNELVGLEFNSLGSGRAGSGAPAEGEKPATEKDIWDRVWEIFTNTVEVAQERFSRSARGFDASPEEVEFGQWRLRRHSWAALKSKLEEEVMEGNLLLKLREKFRYDNDGVPRIWRPTDDIESIYTVARSATLSLIPLLSQIRLSKTAEPPPLPELIGDTPPAANEGILDEDELPLIGGVDEPAADGSGSANLTDEVTLLPPATASSLANRFKKTAEGVYIEAKRSAIGGITHVPLYFYGLLLLLGWNELVAVLRNPLYFLLLAVIAAGAYMAQTLNLWGPLIRMGDAATKQAIEVGKERLREFLEAQENNSSQSRRKPIKQRDSYELKETGRHVVAHHDNKQDERDESEGEGEVASNSE